ncbi:MAG: cytochrome c oxidase assembly protein [Proteobacteria bacterium]|nr:cytochrome c oxidase assembly protein [Pseudomonadota bacterium]
MSTDAKNKKAGLILVAVVAGMVGMAYAAVPLYKLFCQVTGFGGTTQRAEASEGIILDRPMTIRFTANLNHDMPWNFSPSQLTQETMVGQQMLATYRAHNPTSKRITGTAVFNVTPFKAGEYFNKIECFCFTEQTLEPGQSADMPVTYYVDPAIADDPHLDDVKEIVLSYTFFLVDAEEAPEMDHKGINGTGN